MLKKTRSLLFSLGAIGAAWSLAASGLVAAAAASDVPLAVPAGVTLVNVSKGGSEISNGFLWWRLGDSHGNPLYTYDKDGTAGQSTCFGECAQEFPPYLAPRTAVAFGEWSLVSRPEGRQWVYAGRPLYGYAGHTVMPELLLEYDAVVGKGQEHDFEPSSKYFSPKLGWRQAVFDPIKSLPMPADVRLQCLEAANGFAFVVASSGLPIYLLPSDPKAGGWTPLYASSAELPTGVFSIVRRPDGTHQWAFKGERLYTYDGDYSATDINGVVAQKDAHIALAYRFFRPAELAFNVFPTRPPMMTTAKGLSVYTEARYSLQYGGRETRGGYHYSYKDAKAVGTGGCVDACARTWRPVSAPASAQSWGFWEVMSRPDGSRQWAYKGSALYTYVGDRSAGDIKGNNQAVIVYADARDKITTVLGDGFSEAAEEGTEANNLMTLTGGNVINPASYGGTFGAGFYWHLVPLFN